MGRLVKLAFVLFNVGSSIVLFTMIMPQSQKKYPYIIFAIFFSVLVYIFGGLDKQTSRSRNEMLLSYGLSLLISFLLLFAIGGFFKLSISLKYSLIIGFYYTLLLPFIVHMVYFNLFENIQKKNIIIIGTKEEYTEFVDQIMPKTLIPFSIIEHIDYQSAMQYYIPINDKKIDFFIISNASDQLYRKAKDANVSAISLPLLFEKEEKRIPLNMVKQNEKFYLMSFEDNGVNHAIRVLDWIISIGLLIITFPLILISIILIRVVDQENVFYTQVRRGYRGKKFLIYKLSTMIPHPCDKNKYITSRIGKILRKLRINEIPQLFNVLKGEMSIVGPRPDIETTYEYCLLNIPYYHYRTNVLPGITGHAQVHYKYVDKLEVETFSRRLSFDLFYVKNYSLYNYVVIIMKTIGSIILLKGK